MTANILELNTPSFQRFIIEQMMLDPRVYARAADLIARDDGAGFVKHVFCSEANGAYVPLKSEEACRFCVVGGVARAINELGLGEFECMARGALDPFVLVPFVTEALDLPVSANFWNNDRDRTAAEVVEALRAADPSRIRLRFAHEVAA